MSFDFANPWMLAGLAGAALPVIAHLLSKKRFEVVNWGAMQFLELGRETRRRVRLEEFLLLLLRILIIALIAFWMARPWASGGIFKHLVATQPRDVVIVVDSSLSMGWEAGVRTPHQRAIDWAEEFLGELNAGDTVALLDVRDQIRPVIEKPTRDFEYVRDELQAIPPPSGSSNLAEACSKGLQILGQTTNLSREIIVLTDTQARCWSTDDVNRWLRFDDLRKQPAVTPRVWVVDVGDGQTGPKPNFTVGPLKLSRELTVSEFPVRISTTVRYSGGTEPVTKRINLEIDGKELPERAISIQLQPEGEATVEFEHRFPTVGSYVVGVSVDGDPLPGDNRSLAALSVQEAIPVLIVDGDDQLDPTRDETFFAMAALSPPSQKTPLVRATRVTIDEWTATDLSRFDAIFLANVAKLTDTQRAALASFVDAGGGLLLALGNRCDPEFYSGAMADNGLFPGELQRIERAPRPAENADPASREIRIDDETLELPWLSGFRTDSDGTLPEARFESWWELVIKSAANANESGSQAVIAARFNTRSPWLIVSEKGRGRVLVMTSALDADWSTLPTKTDYVPLLHEMVFFLASSGSRRNVLSGVPIIVPVKADFLADKFAFYDPQLKESAVKLTGPQQRRVARHSDTTLPGVYTLEMKPRESDPRTREFFVVDFDRAESDLTALDETEVAFLKQNGRMEFIETLENLRAGMLTDNSRAELWPWFLFIFLGMLVFEVWMTRRLVRGGHVSEELAERQNAELIPPDAIMEIEDFEDYATASPARSVRDSFD